MKRHCARRYTCFVLRIPTEKEYSHERLGERFETALSAYDTQRRLEVLIDRFLARKLEGRTALDVGAGLGFLIQRLQQRGASVTATDIGESMLHKVKETVGCHCECIDALSLSKHFGPNRFDVVLSSDFIDITLAIMEAVRLLAVFLKPGC